MKEGIYTTEFWYAIIKSVVGILVAIGTFTPDQADGFVQAVMAIVGGVIALVPFLTYLWSRTKLKGAVIAGSLPRGR